ncbi:MAG: Nramp family divalent metal transporter [Planctomycetes bacterium]|nr:Nramp family divalent metal transporter [Planctomycetota bacterium]MCH9723880.1 Nramp family divalent metal transporter [Planctomycetota bacterium]MCH9778606.1 Nramp family divalent metal transporter [Planctomycetota bacterium]MCH9790757.1 Nramp family divalent metal transporter [Planctomycetota bacterium]MDF1743614.1 Nramp family divalent metal transporter [Gimesia sp.]
MTEEQTTTVKLHWWQRIGPGLVTACVVIGPGSILTSSNLGAKDGYSMIWVVLVSVIFMLVYTSLGAKLGAVTNESTCTLLAQKVGRPLTVLVGCGVFFISAAYQFGNNLGVHSAIENYTDLKYGIVFFNAISIAFLFGFKNLYKLIERLMSVFVGLMLASFAINLFFAKPDLVEMAQGVIPSPGEDGKSILNISLLGLVGTTFVITAAFYQSYLARFKGWTVRDLKDARIDSRISAGIMALITIMIMATAAAVLRGQDLKGVGDVGNALKPLFGDKGQILFCVGLFSAAYSSFIVNSMIGGFILSDSLGLGSTPQDKSTRILTAVVLLTGMFVALYVIESGIKPVAAIVAAQAVTVVAAPLAAGGLLLLTSSKKVMGEYRNGVVMNIFASIGFVLLLGMAWYIATEKVIPQIQKMRGQSVAVAYLDHSK